MNEFGWKGGSLCWVFVLWRELLVVRDWGLDVRGELADGFSVV